MPGYPLLMAGVYLAGVEPRNVLLLQCFIDALTAVLITSIIYQLQGSRRVAVLGGMLYAVWPPVSYFCLRLYVETILAFVIILLFFLITKKVRWLPFGLSGLCTVGIYIKPNFLLIAGIICLFLLFQYANNVKSSSVKLHLCTGFKRALLFSFIVFVLAAPWVMRNKLVAGGAMLSTVFSVNFLIISAPYTLAELNGDGGMRPWSSLHYEYLERFIAEVKREYPEWVDVMEANANADFEQLDCEAQNAWRIKGEHAAIPKFHYCSLVQLTPPLKIAQRIVRENPVAFLKSHVRGFVGGWVRPLFSPPVVFKETDEKAFRGNKHHQHPL